MAGVALFPLFLVCAAPVAVDGDTLHCRGGEKVRLAGIDAPEMPGHCRRGRRCVEGDPVASRDNLARLVRRGAVRCEASARDGYGRLIATCSAAGVDLACAQLAGGFAVVRYGRLECR